jgi:DNA-binding transcriptional LysR family regulator
VVEADRDGGIRLAAFNRGAVPEGRVMQLWGLAPGDAGPTSLGLLPPDGSRFQVDARNRPPVDNINWLLDAGRKPGTTRRPVLEMNSVYGILQAVQSGLGIAALPDYMRAETSQLVEVLTELKGPKIEAYFVYPEELRNSKRVAVFRDFLLAKIAGMA